MKIGRISELNGVEDKHTSGAIESLYEPQSEIISSISEDPTIHSESLRDTFRGLFSKEGDSITADKKYEEYLAFLEESTASKESDSIESDVDSLTDDEIKDIWDNDPGYISELAMRSLSSDVSEHQPEKQAVESDGPYMTMGYHSDLVNYTDDAEGGIREKKRVTLGQILERYGSEDGSYLAEEGVLFEDLQLPVSEDKLEKHRYEVIQEFEAEKSLIASQPFDERDEQEKEKAHAVQYKTSISIGDLVELGFLKRLD